MKRLAIGIGAVALLLGSGSTGFAFHSGDMAVSSTLAHGGALTIGYDFSTVVRTNYDPVLTSVLPPGMTGYSNDEPGFDALDTDFPGDGLFVVDPGTEVSVEITAIDDGSVGMVLNGTPLLHIGDSTVLGTQGGIDGIHHHPSWQIYLMMPAGSYGDARVSFRIKRTGGATAYADSSVFTLRVSNGHLFPPEWSTTAYDSASVKCQQTLGKAVRKFTGTLQGALERCLDKVTVVTATAATGADTTKAQATAAQTCGDSNGALAAPATMLGKIATARQKALDTILKACGPTGSNTYDTNAISQHLGLAACNVEDTMAGGYHGANEALEAITQGGQPVTASLPCLFPTSEAD